MTAQELAQQCADVISARQKLGLSWEDADILVTTPRGWKAPPKFPRSEIVQWREDGSRVRYMPAVRVLAWLAAQGLVRAKLAPIPAPVSPSVPKLDTHDNPETAAITGGYPKAAA